MVPVKTVGVGNVAPACEEKELQGLGKVSKICEHLPVYSMQ